GRDCTGVCVQQRGIVRVPGRVGPVDRMSLDNAAWPSACGGLTDARGIPQVTQPLKKRRATDARIPSVLPKKAASFRIGTRVMKKRPAPPSALAVL
ncbi:MAG: hypothetical protein AB7O38_31745, partial [Pirellulaceae bacterium]